MDEKIAMLESEVMSLKSQVNMLSCELYARDEKQKDKTKPFEICQDGKVRIVNAQIHDNARSEII